ncbi:hypothetical protein D3C71_1298890 [compost metagenome]
MECRAKLQYMYRCIVSIQVVPCVAGSDIADVIQGVRAMRMRVRKADYDLLPFLGRRRRDAIQEHKCESTTGMSHLIWVKVKKDARRE